MKTPKRACKGCFHCTPYYGNVSKDGKRVVSRYWCIHYNKTASDPIKCEFRKEKK